MPSEPSPVLARDENNQSSSHNTRDRQTRPRSSGSGGVESVIYESRRSDDHSISSSFSDSSREHSSLLQRPSSLGGRESPLSCHSNEHVSRGFESTSQEPHHRGPKQVLQQQQQQQQQRGSDQNQPHSMSTRTNSIRRGHHLDDDEDDDVSWYKRLAEKYGSLELDNKGSVARDHLAIERTFLAWLRTSLAFASIGIGITQLFRLNTSLQQHAASHYSAPAVISDQYQDNDFTSIALDPGSRRLRRLGKPLGATFIGVAMVVLIVGFHRYFQSQYWVVRGKFPASRGSVALIAFIAGALMIGSLVVIVAIAPGSLEV